jgi:lipopolysaccharide heptosyltransferase II
MAAAKLNFEPEKILIVLHGSIGDVVRALPLAKLVKLRFPRAFLAWSVEPAARPLLLGNPSIDEVIVFQRERWWKSFMPFIAALRARGFDLVLDLQRHLKSGVVSRLSGAPHRLGFHPADAKEGNGFFNNRHIERYGETIAKLDHYLKFADYLGAARAPLEWNFALTAAESAAVQDHLAEVSNPYAVLFAGTRWPSKQWFPRQMADCAHMLRSKYALDAILLGSKDDRELARRATELGAGRIVDLVGKTTLREAVGIIQRASLAVGPDTGLMHIAAAVGTPVISLWGATDPARTGPVGFAELAIRGQAPCAPCKRRQCPIGRVCMQSITTPAIAAKAALVFGREAGAQASHGSAS